MTKLNRETKLKMSSNKDPEKSAPVDDGGTETSPDVGKEELERRQAPWWVIVRVIIVLGLLYAFICSLDLMGSAFKLLGGKEAGEVFSQDHVISNPVAGLVIGVLVTVLLQSSSTSTSIIVTMVAADLLTVNQAVPIVMGANIGTSVTSTIVAIGQIQDKTMYERAFAAATMHDMFNLLCVAIMLPLEWITGFLTKLSKEIVGVMNVTPNEDAEVELLSRITDPLMDRVVLVNKTFIKEISKDKDVGSDERVLKIYAQDWKKWVKAVNASGNLTELPSDRQHCEALFCDWEHSDKAAGGLLLTIALVVMFICLFFIVKVLNSIFSGHIAKIVNKFVNKGFPGKFQKLDFLIGYFAILVGCGMTILVQSSSIFTSTLTPLVGLNIIGIERAFPMVLGSNIGTTVTGLLAALASDKNFEQALQISMCHLLFNIIGILIWYPIPVMRRIPLGCARHLGKTTRKYKWFAVVYIFIVFVMFPGIVFALSLAGEVYVAVFCCLLILFGLVITAMKLLQRYAPSVLPNKLKNFKFLPKGLRSLEPYHNAGITFLNLCRPKSRKISQRCGLEDNISDKVLVNLEKEKIIESKLSKGAAVLTGVKKKNNDEVIVQAEEVNPASANLGYDQNE